MHARAVVLLAGALCALVPASGRAQEGHPLPTVGSHAVMFSLPEGGGAGFGIRKMTSERKSVGVEVQLGVSYSRYDHGALEDESRTHFALGVAPDVRLYRRDRGPVVPFMEIEGRLGYQDAHGDAWAVDGGAGLGLGVEWLPLPSMSISGSTGLALTLQHSEGGGNSQTGLNVGAFRSRISLNLYF